MRLARGGSRVRRTVGIVALVDLCIRVAELDGDISLQLVFETDGLRLSPQRKNPTCTPEMAFTTVDFPCATWPIVPMHKGRAREARNQC